MSKKLWLVLSVIFTTPLLLAACSAVATPTTVATAPVQATTARTETVASVQPTPTPASITVSTATSIQPTTSSGENPQSGDLCGGTGGYGQIVSVGSNEFTLKRNDNASDQIVHLTDRATIETSIGFVSLSDLKIGYRVTLIGGPNPDGSFTADTVVVCNGTVPETQPGQ